MTTSLSRKLTMRIARKFVFLGLFGLTLAVLAPSALLAQQDEDTGFWTAPSKLFYLHATGGLAFGENLTCQYIQDLIAPYEISSGGGFWGALRAGFRNIFQVEFRHESIGRHDWTVAGLDTALTIQMAIQPKNVLLWKVNPLFFLQDTLITTFVYYGQVSGISYIDNNALNGWNNGDMKIYGFELLALRKGFEAGIHIEYRDIVFHGLLASGDALAFITKASQVSLAVFMGIGWGY
jgi:hypothetical protein